MKALDPALKPFLDSVKKYFGDNPEALSAQEWRRTMEEMSAATRAPRPAGLHVWDEALQANGRSFRVRVYQPDDVAKARPGLIYMHGGGWVLGSIDTHDGITAAIAAATGITVFSVDYSLAPEHPYPAALEDVQATVKWVRDQALDLGLDLDRLMIGGDSAGGNMAAALCLKLRDAGQMPFCHQLLVYPVVAFEFDQPSYVEHKDAPFLNLAEMQFFRENYLTQREDWTAPYAAPLHATSLAGVPPATILVAEFDPLRDEGGHYAARLIAAGVNVTYRLAADLPHGFLRMRAWSASAEREIQAMCAALRQAAT